MEEHPAERAPRNHGRQAQDERRCAQMAPKMQYQEQQRRMSGIEAGLVGSQPGRAVPRQEMQRLIRVEKCSPSSPEPQEKSKP